MRALLEWIAGRRRAGRFRAFAAGTLRSLLPEVRPASVFRRLLDIVDDENLHRAFSRFQFQAKLLLERRKDGGPGRIRRGRTGRRWTALGSLKHRTLALIRR